MAELKSLGSPSIKKVMVRHGAQEPYFGVKIEDLKKIAKRMMRELPADKRHKLVLALYATGCGDAMYLAGLAADDEAMTREDLVRWVKAANWSMISDFTVPWVAAGNRHGPELAREWIESPHERIASAGWNTFSSLAATRPDEELDLSELKGLLARVEKTIHSAQNCVRYNMNGFVIALAAHVVPLSETAIAAARRIGVVEVDMGDTNCQVPFAPEYIEKVIARRGIKKRKSAKCE